MNNNKVVISGMGMVTSLGSNVEETWNQLLEGKSGAKKISYFDASELETQFAAEINDEFENKLGELVKKRDAKKMTRITKIAMVAADEAVRDSNIDFAQCDLTRVAVIMGIVSGGYNDVDGKISKDNYIIKSMSNALSAWISLKYGILGPNFSVATACASSAYAMGLGHQLIKSGAADVVIVGGADSHISKHNINGFNEIMALSTRNESPESASRPFSKDRDGFVMGEGAGMLVLESEKHAQKRNAKIYAELAGYALTSEATDITAPQKDGEGMKLTMNLAMESSGVLPEEVDYINAHGTSTYLNDKYETMAIKSCFGEKAYDLFISSTKSMIGHTIGAAGAIEGIVTILSIYNRIITPTINYINKDEELDLNYVPNKAVAKEVNVAISNSFGFGGHNASLVFKKYVEK